MSISRLLCLICLVWGVSGTLPGKGALAMSLSELDDAAAQRIMDARPAAAVLAGVRSEDIADTVPANTRAEHLQKALSARRQVLSLIDELLRLPPHGQVIGYWQNIQQAITTLKAMQRLEETWKLNGTPHILTDALWTRYVSRLDGTLAEGTMRINNATGAQLIRQWFLRNNKGVVRIAELYATPEHNDLQWSVADYDTRVSDPREFVRTPDVAARPATVAERLLMFIDASGADDATLQRLKAAVSNWIDPHLSIFLKARDRAAQSCESQPASQAGAAAADIDTKLAYYRACIDALGSDVYAGKTLIMDPALGLQVQFVDTARVTSDFDQWTNWVAYMAKRWPQ